MQNSNQNLIHFIFLNKLKVLLIKTFNTSIKCSMEGQQDLSDLI